MINLVCRFYDIDEGAIMLDGVDIRKIKLRDLRRNIGIVPQESFLFNGTIADNIAYARPGSTRDEIMQAAIAANAHGFIMRFPDGYDTIVGERGSRVSGGEKQRIAIARAILHDPKILILDEATSLVDTQTESLIQEALTNLVKGRTTFAIAHRLSTLKNADKLLVIDDGKKAEFGTHDELLENKGVYYKLVEMQTKLSAIKAVDG
jgi:ATP-binding cassette subfamily B protein